MLLKQEIDPICGHTITSEEFNTLYEGVNYYFCSKKCLGRFQIKPEKYSLIAQSHRNLKKKFTSILNQDILEKTEIFNGVITNIDYTTYIFLIKELEKDINIKNVEINPFTGTISIEYLIHDISQNSIIEKINKLGFDYSNDFIITNEVKDYKFKVIISLISSIILYLIQNNEYKAILPDFLFNNYINLIFVTLVQFYCSFNLYKDAIYHLSNKIFTFSLLSTLFTTLLYIYSFIEVFSPKLTTSNNVYFAEFSILMTILLLEKNTFLLLKKSSIENYKMIVNYLNLGNNLINNNISINNSYFKKNIKIIDNYEIFIFFACIINFLFWNMYDRSLGIGETLFLTISPVAINLPFLITTSLVYPFLTNFPLKKNFIFKNSKAVESIYNTDTLLFDKTVVIEDKIPMITDIYSFNGFDGNTVLKISASVENQADNLIAKAIVREARIRRFNLWTPSAFHQILGVGIESIVNGYHVYIGSRELMKMKNINISLMDKIANKLSSEFKTAVFIAIDGKPAGIIGSQNKLKNDAVNIADILKKINIKMFLMTGDSFKSGLSYGESLGLNKDHIYTDCIPSKKVKIISDLKSKGLKVAILKNNSKHDTESEYYKANREIIIAMNKSLKDHHYEDVNVYNPDIKYLKEVFCYSSEVIKKVRQNLIFSYAYILFNLLFAFGLLIKFTNIQPSPIILGIFSLISLIFVYINSLKNNNTDK